MSIIKKKQFLIPTVILVLILIIAYLFAFFNRGFWHNGTFLYQTGNGHFKSVTGNVLAIQKAETQTDIVFTAKNETRQYQLLFGADGLQILENGNAVYTGTAVFGDGRYYLEAENGELILDESNVGSSDAFPSRTELLNWALIKEPVMHGHIPSLVFLEIASAMLALTFLKRFRHRTIAKWLRIPLILCILIFAVLGLILT